VGRFIYFSTGHVYGALAGRIDEATPARSTHPYGIAHRAAEDWVLAAHARGQLSGLVIRLSNGFGAPAHPHISRWTLLVNDLCRQAVETRTLILRGDGGEWRNFIPLADVENMVVHLLHLPDDLAGDGLFNAGSLRSTRVIDMADLVAARCERILQFRPALSVAAQPAREHPLLDYRIDRLQATGFVPAGDFEHEIDRTLRVCAEWFLPRPGDAP
jgi:UDP-glucose 4-epimerase